MTHKKSGRQDKLIGMIQASGSFNKLKFLLIIFAQVPKVINLKTSSDFERISLPELLISQEKIHMLLLTYTTH